MEERRQKERKKTGVFFGVYNRDNGKYLGRLVDLTTNGLLLFGKNEFKVNNVYRLKMDLPEPIKEKSQVVFKARCKWCEQSKNTSLFSGGLEFIDIDNHTTALIDELVGHSLYNNDSGGSPISMIVESEDF